MKKIIVIILICSGCASYYTPVINGERVKIKRPHYKTDFQRYVLNQR